MKTIIIGDIHGSYRSLKDLLVLCNFDNKKDRLICIGDYIDGWNESVKLVDFLIKLQIESNNNHIFIKGNHDKWFLDIMNKDFLNFENKELIKSKYHYWIKNSGLSTYKSYLSVSKSKREFHRASFFSKLKNYHIENNILFVHAGFDTDKSFYDTIAFDEDSLFWNRTLFHKAMQIWNLKNKRSNNIAFFGGFKKIFIGHTPTCNFGINKPILMHNVINIDQGCKIHGSLTGWILETGKYYQTKKIDPNNLNP